MLEIVRDESFWRRMMSRAGITSGNTRRFRPGNPNHKDGTGLHFREPYASIVAVKEKKRAARTARSGK